MADSLVGANLIHDVGYMESGLTFSGELLVLCSEIISWIKAFKKGMPINRDTLALELIDQLGFAGDFLSSDHTLEHYREQWEPELFDRHDYEGWEQRGRRTVRDRIRDRIESILSEPPRSRLTGGVAGEISAISARARSSASA
jgi:trimethylamine--corrinoid protein Co-methyltransferase